MKSALKLVSISSNVTVAIISRADVVIAVYKVQKILFEMYIVGGQDLLLWWSVLREVTCNSGICKW